jgi:protein-disulfide isomerase-like protein with CxxC motif
VPARVTYITDPACAASWGVEPMVRRLMADFGDQLNFTYVMGGLAREWAPEHYPEQIVSWLEHAERSRMPFDPLIWDAAPLRSSYPASPTSGRCARASSASGASSTPPTL